ICYPEHRPIASPADADYPNMYGTGVVMLRQRSCDGSASNYFLWYNFLPVLRSFMSIYHLLGAKFGI
ncbi:MAG: hypothetical protein WCG34_08965, partial [Leptolinea sp.]